MAQDVKVAHLPAVSAPAALSPLGRVSGVDASSATRPRPRPCLRVLAPPLPGGRGLSCVQKGIYSVASPGTLHGPCALARFTLGRLTCAPKHARQRSGQSPRSHPCWHRSPGRAGRRSPACCVCSCAQHHCRACGGSYCGPCSPHLLRLPELGCSACCLGPARSPASPEACVLRETRQ